MTILLHSEERSHRGHAWHHASSPAPILAAQPVRVSDIVHKPYHLSHQFPRTCHVPVESLPTLTFGPLFTYAMLPTPVPNKSRSMSSVLPTCCRPARPLQRKAHAPPVMSRLHHFGCLGTPVLHLRAICTAPHLAHGPGVNVGAPSSSPAPAPAP